MSERKKISFEDYAANVDENFDNKNNIYNQQHIDNIIDLELQLLNDEFILKPISAALKVKQLFENKPCKQVLDFLAKTIIKSSSIDEGISYLKGQEKLHFDNANLDLAYEISVVVATCYSNGGNHEITLDVLSNIEKVYNSTSAFKDAKKIFERKYLKANSLYFQNQISDFVISTFKNCIVEDYFALNSYWNLGCIFYESDDFIKALGFYLEANNIDPNNAPILSNICLCYLKSGQIHLATGFLDQIRDLDTNHIEIYDSLILFNLGLCYKELNNLDLASEYFGRAHNLEGANERYLEEYAPFKTYDLACNSNNLNFTSQDIKHFKILIELNYQVVDCYYFLAYHHTNNKFSYGDAIKYIDICLQNYPTSTSYLELKNKCEELQKEKSKKIVRIIGFILLIADIYYWKSIGWWNLITVPIILTLLFNQGDDEK